MVKRIINFWREWCTLRHLKHKQVENVQALETPAASVIETSGKTTGNKLSVKLEKFLTSHYEFRYNVLTEQAEVRKKENDKFRPVNQRVANTLCLHAQEEGIACWDKDVIRYLNSERLPDFHPLLTYMAELPEWDGIDRVTPLAERISTKEIWMKGFHRWMLGVAAQWSGQMNRCANSLAPMLISTCQGMGKSTFCRRLMPDSLADYYTDSFDLNSQGACEQKLSLFGLINMDEFDRYSERSQATLKNLMQLRKLTFRKSHRSYYSQLPRIASFIGTSNQKELLTDSTGSRRFLCVEVKKKIDCNPPDYAQLYAQLKTELLAGERFWFSAEEEKEIQENNRAFYKQSPAQEIFFRCFRLPKDEEAGRMMTATEIFCRLQKKFPSALRKSNASQMGKVLQAIGVQRTHTRMGNTYYVVPV